MGPPPLWLYTLVLTGLFVLNVAVAAWFLRRIREPGAWLWAGITLLGAAAGLHGALKHALLFGRFQGLGGAAVTVSTIAYMGIAFGFLIAVAVAGLRKRGFASFENPRFSNVRHIALAGFLFTTSLTGGIADSVFGLIVTAAVGILLVLMAPMLWGMLKESEEKS